MRMVSAIYLPPEFSIEPIGALCRLRNSQTANYRHVSITSSKTAHISGNEVMGTDEQGVVVLQGRVETFYHKQVAQELLRKVDGVERIVNLLEVHWGQ